jgi:hypothetical protein
VKDVLLDFLQFGDLMRHLLLAGHQLVDALRYLLLSGRDTGGKRVDASPQQVEIGRHSVELLIGRSSRQRDQMPGRVTVGLPTHSSSDTNEKRDQMASEGEWSSLSNRRPLFRQLVIFRVGRSSSCCLD